jgi:type IV pilus assembly protein PilA
MIVVAIIGVLAALAIYGVRRYLTAAKAAEAKESVGEIARSAHAAFERERMPVQWVDEGQYSQSVSHELCGSASPVPAAVPPGRRYQPITTAGSDFQTGDDSIGWTCLRFSISQPIYYQLNYTKNGAPVAANAPMACANDCYEAGALGDLDGNGVLSRFARTGQINTTSGSLKASTNIYTEDESE